MEVKNIEQLNKELQNTDEKIKETTIPLRNAEMLLREIEGALSRGQRMRVNDYSEFIRLGGDNKLKELSKNTKDQIDKIDKLKLEYNKVLTPLLYKKSRIEKLIEEIKNKNSINKEKIKEKRLRGEIPIDLERWINRLRWSRSLELPNEAWILAYKIIGMAKKREAQIINEICAVHELKLVERKNLTDHYSRKYKKYRLKRYKRGIYLLPNYI